MHTFKVKIYDHTGLSNKRWQKRQEQCNQVLHKYANCEVFFSIEQREFEIINFNKPFKRGDKTYRKPNRTWFETNFTKPAAGSDFVVANYSQAQFNKSNSYDVNGYSGEHVGGVSEILMFGEKGSTSLGDGLRVNDWVHTFLHEMSHGVFDHKMGRPDKDVTHDYDTSGNRNLVRALEKWQLHDSDGSFHQVAVHNTAVMRTDKNQLIAVNKYHRDTRKYPKSTLGWHVAYNYFIDTDGTLTNTRAVGEETYANRGHNCDVPSRCDTISVCFALNGDEQVLNVHQKHAFRELMSQLGNKQITLHRNIQANRTCPGKNITEQYLYDVLDEKEENADEKADEIGKNLQIGILKKMIEILKILIALQTK